MKKAVGVAALLCLFAQPGLAAERFGNEQAARRHCPSDTVVWLNLRSGVVHAKGQPWYGRTQSGAYVCRKELAIRGDKAVEEVRPAASGWHKVAGDDERTVHLALHPSAKTGHVITILSLTDLRRASALSDGTAFLSWETQYRFDCGKRLSRVEAASMYAGNMGEGEVVGSVVYEDPEWKPVVPGSNGELLWKSACGMK